MGKLDENQGRKVERLRLLCYASLAAAVRLHEWVAAFFIVISSKYAVKQNMNMRFT